MSYEEKGVWVYLVSSLGVYVAYLIVIVNRAGDGPLAEVAYVSPMLWAIGIGIAANVVGRIVVEIAKPSESHRGDARDRDIDRHGQYVGGLVLSVLMVGPFALTLADAAHFWIAQAIYAAFVLGTQATNVVKLVAYRRGL